MGFNIDAINGNWASENRKAKKSTGAWTLAGTPAQQVAKIVDGKKGAEAKSAVAAFLQRKEAAAMPSAVRAELRAQGLIAATK